MINKYTASHYLASLILTISSVAHGAGKDEAGGTFSTYIENDLFAGTDRYYTSGVKLSWSSSDLEKYSDTPYASALLPLFELRLTSTKPDTRRTSSLR